MKRNHRPQTSLSIEDVRLALRQAQGVTRVLLEVLYASGARVSEVAGLRWRDVDFEERTVRLQGKGGDERLVPLGQPAVAALVAWANNYAGSKCPGIPQEATGGAFDDAACVGERPDGAERGAPHKIRPDGAFLNGTDRVFGGLTTQNIRDRLAALGRKTGLRLTPHLFRHAMATHMHYNGANIRVLQELLGHRRCNTTQIYLDVSDRTILDNKDLITRCLANARGRGEDMRGLRRVIDGGLVLR